MFLRSVVRSLPFSLSGTSSDKARGRKDRQWIHSPSGKHQFGAAQVPGPEVDTSSAYLGPNGNNNVGNSTAAVTATTSTTSVLQGRAQVDPLPNAEAEAHSSRASAITASTLEVSPAAHVTVNSLEASINQQAKETPHSAPRPTSSSSPAKSRTVVPSTARNTSLVSSTCTSAEHGPASNFPSHPLHNQTLSPRIDHVQTDNTKEEPARLTQFAASPSSQKPRYEPGTAMQRKLWVKRPGASATRVEVSEDDLVDNVRDVILQKYANSLGRHIDAPDITLKILSREQANKSIASERVLGPEESVGRTLDTYYPGGQTIEEALIIEVPQKRTPKPSPRPGNHHLSYYIPEDYRPGDGARDYFPPMPLQSPHVGHVQHPAVPAGALPVHSMSILTTGQVPALPSPGGHSRARQMRPKYPRQHTSSPTIVHSSQPNGIDAKAQLNGVTAPAQPLPTPPPAAGDKNTIQRTTSPHPSKPRRRRQPTTGRSVAGEPLPTKPASAGLLDGKVPPINVLLVEDNVINLKLLEQFMKRLKVRWKSAMNGKEAVSMWRQGGFHLVLMDIQLPVMNGLEATKEIRRLESVNGIGISVFDETTHHGKTNGNGQVATEDRLEDRKLFKSPVIIVALTASSLQSDRHEALAVGCNDFLTKPVNFVWMERKVTEWGCMQALIDFDGWRRWKAIADKKASEDPEKKKQEEQAEKAKAKAALKAMFSRPPPSTKK